MLHKRFIFLCFTYTSLNILIIRLGIGFKSRTHLQIHMEIPRRNVLKKIKFVWLYEVYL